MYVSVLLLLQCQTRGVKCIWILWWWQTSVDVTRDAFSLYVCVCVCFSETEYPICGGTYLGLRVFVPEHKCDAALCSYAFIWKIGRFPWESPSLSTHTLCLFHYILSCLSICSFHTHIPHSLVSPTILSTSRLSVLSHFLPALSLSASFCFSTHTFSLTPSLTELVTQLTHTHTPTHTLVCSLCLHLFHCCFTVDPSFCLWLPLNLYN